MNDSEFDRALVASAFRLIAERGWSRLSLAEAARRADLPLDRARARFPARPMVLLRFGSIADQAALSLAPSEGAHRDRLFDILMRRIDVLQSHRDGVLALLRGLRTDPCSTGLVTAANLRSMMWMLDGAGIGSTGVFGLLRAKGLMAVWLSVVHAWRNDTSQDLSATMAALDKALAQAERIEGWLTGRRSAPPTEPPHPAEPSLEPEPPAPLPE
jgi:ubiquinone biosynthesis protein COQ9